MAAPARLDTDPPHMWQQDSIEERGFAASLISLEGHYQQSPVLGPQSMAKVMSIISKTLEKTHTYKDVREVLSKNIRIWIWLRRAISAAICDLNEKSLGVRSEPFVATRFMDITTPEVTALIIKNYTLLKEALQMLNKLMHIARNLLVTTNPEIPQNLSATINFDHEVIEAICLCVNVLSKGIDGEMSDDDASRVKLNEIAELYKKVLVTSLQQAHNWIAKNERNKMTFWYRVFIESPDVDLNPEHDDRYDIVGATPSPRCLYIQEEVRNWIKRNTVMCRPAAAICQQYFEAKSPDKPDLWFPHQNTLAFIYSNPDETDDTPSTWNPDAKEKFSQDWQYGRVSHELDVWWTQARLPNTTNMDNPQFPTAFLNERIRQCEETLMSRYAPPESPDEAGEGVEHHVDDATVQEWPTQPPPQDTPHYAPEYDEYEEEADDDDSYGEGPMTGLLTEVPNILDPKQIEALHMIIKSCILESAGSGLTRHGESLQHARCRIMLATECGRNLLREMLVFIAVWEKDEQSLIFQISSQIVQALHESCLIHHAWEAVRSPKDIMSPAQTVLLRLITYLARTALLPSRDYNPDPDPDADPETRLANPNFRLSRMLHYFYTIFRNRIAPECIALMRIQGEVRAEAIDPADFPVDNWDLERAKDGLVQFLDFLYTIADIYPLRQHLIEYDAVYDLIKLLEGLDLAVERAPLPVNRPRDMPPASSASAPTPQPLSSGNPPPPPPPPPPPLSEPPHEFPWAGIKGQVLAILAALLQPPPGQSSPGNPAVQLQIVKHNGIVALLNCCLYDDNNRFCRERTELCLKWLMDGSPDAAAFLQNIISANQNRPVPGGQPQPVRIDGVPGEVKIQVRQSTQPPPAAAPSTSASAPVSPPTPAPAPAPATPIASASTSASTLVPVPPIPTSVSPPHLPELPHPYTFVPVRPDPFLFETNLAASRSQAAALARRLEENKSRSEELVNDLLALTVSTVDSRAPPSAPVDADETEEEDFM